MSSERFYDEQNDYLNTGSFGSLFTILGILIIGAIFLALSNSFSSSQPESTKAPAENGGIAEYWYSDTPENKNQTNLNQVLNTIPKKATVTDKTLPRRYNMNSPTQGTLKAMFFWI